MCSRNHVRNNPFSCWIYSLMIMVLLGSGVKSQTPYFPSLTDPLPETWRWHHMEFLSAKGVRSMCDDHDGNMWFGLDRGILRYDGYHWDLFDNETFLDHPTGTLFLSSQNILYAGNDAGLLSYADRGWEKIFPENDSISLPVSCISQSLRGDLLIGVQNGMVIFGNEKFTIYTANAYVNQFRQAHPQAKIVVLPDEVLFQRNFGRIDELHVDNNQEIWMFMSRNNDGKLIRFHPNDTLQGVLTNFNILSSIGGQAIANRSHLLVTSDSTYWIINGFYKSGILKFRQDNFEYTKLSDQFGGDELHTSILEARDGSVWVGGLGKLYVYKNKAWKVFASPKPMVPSSRILLHESRNGWVWIAGSQGDVFRINYGQENWTTYKGLNFQAIDKNEIEWFIDAAGSIVYNQDERWYSFDPQDGAIDSPVKLIVTGSGSIWIAGSHNGVAATAFLSNNGKWVKQLHPEVSWGIDARSVFQSRDGSIWFGASVDRQEDLGHRSGVLQLKNPDEDPLIWMHHTQQQGITQQNAYGIGQSPDGTIWLGGTNLLYYDSTRWRRVEGIEHFNEFIDIVHSNHYLWVGSRYYGIFKFDGMAWQHFTNLHGLPSNTIISVYEESPKSVWVITDKGIARYDGKSWQSEMFPDEFQIAREGGEIYATSEGTVWINKSHRVWKRRAFPYSITPDYAFDDFWTVRYQGDSSPPKTNIHLFTEMVDSKGNTLIGWQANDYWEETARNEITYSYRLNDREWSDFSKETSVVFTELKDGKYTFEVKARDKNFSIEEVPASIQFTVRPPIWKQRWFIGLVMTFLIIIGWYEYRLIQRNRSLFRLNTSLTNTNKILELSKREVEIQKEKVEELSQVKQRFFTNISHEFRTPLTLIMGSIAQLLTANESDKDRLTRAYEIIQRNTNRILRLINQILEIRKIETGKLSLHVTDGDIAVFTHQIISLFHDMAQVREVNLTSEMAQSSIPASFDHDKLEKIMFNLLSNAFKTTEPGDSIKVSLHCRQINPNELSADEIYKYDRAASSEQISKTMLRIRISVSDTGRGIPSQYLDRIFDRFYQVDESYRFNKLDSSGIGLSYVKDLVSTHHGEITVKSQPGEGTVFTVSLDMDEPCRTGQPDQSMYAPHEASLISKGTRLEIENLYRGLSSFANKNDGTGQVSGSHNHVAKVHNEVGKNTIQILVVEDEHDLRAFICNILEKNFEIIEAADGLDGLEKAISIQPDLIITDVMMPRMDGNELCSKLKSNFITNHIPVLMLTAQAAPENKLKGYQTGADAYLEKPFDPAFLKVRINNLILAQQKTRDRIMHDLITQPKDIIVESVDDKMLKRIQEVLEENIANSDFDVESLSQQFYLSRFHFSRKVKQLTGHSPKEIIDTYRLKRAGQLLQQQKLPISEVAYMVGFDHPNSFSRAFKKFYNMSPTEFASQN